MKKNILLLSLALIFCLAAFQKANAQTYGPPLFTENFGQVPVVADTDYYRDSITGRGTIGNDFWLWPDSCYESGHSDSGWMSLEPNLPALETSTAVTLPGDSVGITQWAFIQARATTGAPFTGDSLDNQNNTWCWNGTKFTGANLSCTGTGDTTYRWYQVCGVWELGYWQRFQLRELEPCTGSNNCVGGSGCSDWHNTMDDGGYALSHDPYYVHGQSDWHTGPDHTGNLGGMMLVVNAALEPGMFYSRTIPGLCYGAQFDFRSYYEDLDLPNVCGTGVTVIPINIRYEVWSANPGQSESNSTVAVGGTACNGAVLLADTNTGDVSPSTAITWYKTDLIFTTPQNQDSVFIILRNNAPGGCGNDLAIDDITFSPYVPFTIGYDSVTTNYCSTGQITLEGIITSGSVPASIPYVFQWQDSVDGSGVWTDVGSPISSISDASLVLNIATIGRNAYRLVSAASAQNLNNSNCYVASPNFDGNSVVIPTGSITTTTPSVCGTSGGASEPASFTINYQGNTFPWTYYYQINGVYYSHQVKGQDTTINISIKATTTVTLDSISVSACVVNINSPLTIEYDIASPPAPIIINGPSPACIGSTASFWVAVIPDAVSYNWEVSGGGWEIISGQGTDSVQLMIGTTSIDVQITVENACGSNTYTSSPFQTTNNAPPAPASITTTNGLCIPFSSTGDTSMLFQASTVAGAQNYDWTWSSDLSLGTQQSGTGQFLQSIILSVPDSATSFVVGVQAEDACGYSAVTQVTFTVNHPTAAPTVSITQPTCSVATGTITVTAPTGVGLTYSINGSTYQSSTTFSGLAANTNYTVTVKSAAGCISPGTPAAINAQPSTPSAPTATLVQPTCSVATGSITVTAPTGAGLTYSIGGTYQSGTTFSSLSPNTYNVTVQNAAGCISTATPETINAQPSTPSAPTATLVQPTCSVATGSITVTAPTGAGLTYSIGGTYQSGTTFSSLSPNTYNVTVQNAAGCISTATPETINAQPSTPSAPTATLVQPTCSVATGSITVTAPTGAGLTYSIGGTYQSGTTFSSLSPNTYNVTVQNAAGCISTATPETINAQPSTPSAPTATLVQPTCSVATGSITVTAPTGAGLTYSIGGTYQSGTTFSSLSPNTYNVTVQNAAGCISTATPETINAQPPTPDAPTVSLTQPTCTVATGTISVTAPTGSGLTYSIDGSTYQSSTTFSGLPASTDYTVTVQNTYGCTSSGTPADINAQPPTPDAPTVSLTQPTCTVATGTITVTAPTGNGLTYSIDGSTYQSSTTFSGLPASTDYTVTVQNTYGCISSGTPADINAQPPTPDAPTVSLTQPTCTVATGTITVTAPTGDGLTYSIDGSTYQSSTTFSGLPAGTDYTVTVQNTYGCISSGTPADINAQPPTPDAPTVSLTQPTCTVATGTITVTAPTGNGLTYSIDGSTYQSSTTFSDLPASTNYTVTVQNTYGCISSGTPADINAQPPTPDAPTVSLTQPTCTVATGTISVTAPLGSGLTYSIDGSTYQSSTTFSGLPASTDYTVTVQNTYGCTSSGTPADINAQPPTPDAPTVSLTQPTCTVATGTITVTAPLGSGLTYSIDGSTYQSSPVFSGLPASTDYTVTVQNTYGCTSSGTPADINAQPPTPDAPTVSLTQPTCTVATGTITVTAPTGDGLTYSIDGSTYQSSTTFSGLPASTDYTVTVQNTYGCISSGTPADINAQPPTPDAPTVSLTQPTCTVATGTISVTAPLGSGLTYSIDGSTYQSSTTFSGLPASTDYTVTVQNTYGCTSSGTPADINAQPPTPDAPTVSLTQPTCTVATGTITVTAPLGSGLTYSIDGSTYQSSPVFSGLPASTDYTVTVQNTYGCTSSGTPADINAQPPTPDAPTVSLTQPTCTVATGTITVTAPTGDGLTYSIDGSTYQSSTTFSGLPASTDYTVTVQNTYGCTSGGTPADISAQPPTPDAPTVSLTQPTCAVGSGTITVTAPTGDGLTYSIDGSTYQSSTTFSGLPASTDYTVTVQNTYGCTSSGTPADINAQPPTPDAPTVSLTQPTCTVATGTISVTAPLGSGLTYSIDGSTYQSSTTFSGLPASTDYTVTVQNTYGCTSGGTPADISAQPPTPDAPTVSLTQPTCAVGSGTITVTAPLGSGLTYSIDGSDYQSGTTFDRLPPDNYNVTVENTYGCISSGTPAVINAQPETPSDATVTLTQPTCLIATGTITVTSPTGSGLTYSIDDVTFQSSTTFSDLSANSYNVYVQNAAGCVSMGTPATINAQPPTPDAPTVSLTQPTCTVATGTITVTAPTGSGLTYSIDGSTYQSSTTFSGLPASTDYTVTVQNTYGCTSGGTPADINAQPPTPDAPTVSLTQPTCTVATGTITVTAPTGNGLTYSIDGSTYQSSTTFSDLPASTNYTVTVQNTYGCISSGTPADINAQPPTPDAPTVSLTQPTCTVATGTITVTAPTGDGLTYSIDGSTYQSSTTFSGLPASTDYTVTVQNTYGCISSGTPADINAQPPTPDAPTVSLTQPTCTVATGTITVTAPTGDGLTYSIDGSTYQSSTTFSGLPASTDYTVTVQNTYGCTSSGTPADINAQPPTPDAPTVSLTQPTCTVATGTITVTAPTGDGLTYSIDGSTYQSSTTFSGLPASTDYTVTVQNTYGCISSGTPADINAQPPTPDAPTVSLTQPTCTVATGTISVTAPLGSGLTYSIDGSTYQSSTTFSGLPASTDYTVTVQNTYGCTSSGTPADINAQPPTPDAPTVSLTQPTCTVATGTITVTAPLGSGLTYSIDGSTYQSSPVFSGLPASTDYTVTVQNTYGCTSGGTPADISAQPPTPDAPTVSLTQPTCAVGSGTITVTAPLGSGLTYSIDGSDYQSGTTFDRLPPDNYNVTVENTYGCISSGTPAVINAQPETPSDATVTLTQPTCLIATGTITVTSPTGSGLTYSIDDVTFQSSTTFSDLSANSYNVYVQNAAGCVSMGTPADINAQPPTPDAPTVSLTQPTCTVATGTISVTAPLGSGLTYSIDGSTYQSSTTFSGLPASTDYTVTVQNTYGCTSSGTPADINAQPPTPDAPTVSLTQPTCTVATGTITVTAPTGNGLTYSIDGSTYQSSTTFSDLPASTNYTVTVQNTYGCISSGTPADISAQPPTPDAPTVSLTQPTCTVATGTITVTAPTGDGLTYSIDGSTYQSSTTFSGLPASTDYTVTVQNTYGCTSGGTPADISAQPPTPDAPTVSLTQPTCAVGSGTITVTAPLGSGLTYSIDGSDYQSGTTFDRLPPDNYNVTVENTYGCISSGTPAVINAQPETPSDATVTLTQPTCLIATGTITVTSPTGSGLTYSIDDVTFQSSTTFSDLSANSYNVYVQNAAGCISMGTPATINAQPPTPDAPTVSLTQPTCTVATGTITVTAPLGSGLTYSIDGSTYQSSTTFSGLPASTDYTVTVQNTYGCTSGGTPADINVQPPTPAAPTVSLTQPTCAVATGTITVTSPIGSGLTYSIGSGYQSSTTFSYLAANTNYNVTVENASGCISTGTPADINAQPATPAAPTVTITQPTCTVATGTITVTAPTGTGLTYSIGSGYQTSTTFSGVAANTNYNVTVENASGCISTGTPADVNAQPATPAAPIVTVTQPTCSLATGTITVTAPTGSGLTYSDGGAYQTSTTFSGLGANNYNVTVKNASGCISTGAPADVNAQPATPAAPTVTVTQPTCTVATGTITVTAPTGTGLTYSIGSGYQTSTTFSGVAANTNYNVTVENASGCISTGTPADISAQPTGPAAPTVTITQPTCTVATGTITVTAPTGSGLTYSDGGTYQSSTTFSGLVANSYNVTVKNASGCISTATVAVINAAPTSPAAPTVTITQPTCSVATGTIKVTAPTGTGLTYSINGSTYQTSATFSSVAPGSYNVTVKNASGCISTATVAVINAQTATPSAPTVTVTQPTCSVPTGTITVTAPLGTGLEYNDGGAYQTSPTFAGLTPKTYSVMVENAAGCISPCTQVVINAAPAAPAAPCVTITQPTCTVATGTITVTSPTGTRLTYSINGSTYQTSTTFSGVAPGSYNVTVKNASGCISSVTVAAVSAQPTAPAAPTVTITQPTCSVTTGTITVTAPTGSGLTYSINGSTYQTSATFSGVAPGSHNVTVKNASGCISACTVAVVNAAPAGPAAPTVTITQPTCTVATGTITVTAPTGTGLTYSINGSTYQTSTTFSGVAPGSYKVTVKNASGCISAATTAVVNAQPTISCTIACHPQSGCNPNGGGPGAIYLGYGPQCDTFITTCTGGTSYTYSWTGNCLNSTTCANPICKPTGTGSFTQTCTVTCNNGCKCTCSIDNCVFNPCTGSNFNFCHNGSNCVCTAAQCASYIKGYPNDHLGTCTQTCGNALDEDEISTAVSSTPVDQDEFNVKIYPNPFANEFHLRIITSSDENINLKMLDITGQVLYEKHDLSAYEDVLLGNGMASGLYLIQIVQGEKMKVLRIVKSE